MGFVRTQDQEEEEMFQSFELNLDDLEQDNEANIDLNYSFGRLCQDKMPTQKAPKKIQAY